MYHCLSQVPVQKMLRTISAGQRLQKKGINVGQVDKYIIMRDVQAQASDNNVFPPVCPLSKRDSARKENMDQEENPVDPGRGRQISFLAYTIAVLPLVRGIYASVIPETEGQRKGKNVRCCEPQEREDVQQLKSDIRAETSLFGNIGKRRCNMSKEYTMKSWKRYIVSRGSLMWST
jgi:hypothetical protein